MQLTAIYTNTNPNLFGISLSKVTKQSKSWRREKFIMMELLQLSLMKCPANPLKNLNDGITTVTSHELLLPTQECK